MQSSGKQSSVTDAAKLNLTKARLHIQESKVAAITSAQTSEQDQTHLVLKLRVCELEVLRSRAHELLDMKDPSLGLGASYA